MTLQVTADPAKVDAAIVSAETELAALRDEHDQKAEAADEVWRQVLHVERRLELLRQLSQDTAASCDGQS
jgi:hypothetical protein